MLAAVSVFTRAAPPAAVRVVIIDADAGGGGSRGPLRGHAPAGELAGPPAAPPMRSASEQPRIAARPHKNAKRPPAPPRPAAETAREPRAEPTPDGGAVGGAKLALSTGADGNGAGGGGGGTGGGAGPGSGSGVGSGRGPGVESAIARYLRTVRTRLEAVKRYPVLARRSGAEGTATLAIDIRRDGRPATVRVSGSSGSELLDDEAAEMVDRAAPFDPLPSELDESTLRVVVPVSFDLGS